MLLGGFSNDLDTWLIIMVIVSLLRIGLWDLFQMAFFIAYKWGDKLLTGMALQVSSG